MPGARYHAGEDQLSSARAVGCLVLTQEKNSSAASLRVSSNLQVVEKVSIHLANILVRGATDLLRMSASSTSTGRTGDMAAQVLCWVGGRRER